MTRVEAVAIARAARAAKRSPMPQRFWEKVDCRSAKECWPWKAFTNKGGYGSFRSEGKSHLASRWAWMLTNGELSKGEEICHRCDNPSCCNPGHLFVGTHSENIADSVAKGRQVKGSRVGVSVLTEERVIALRTRVAEVGLRVASEEMGIKYWTARYACNEGWRHV